jgi:serine/threonine-protein kinase RsbW
MNDDDKVLRVSAEVEQLAEVRRFVRDQAARLGANQKGVHDVVQAVDESVTNAIVHGYSGATGFIEVEVDHAGRSLIVKLRDQAPPFDPTTLPDPDTALPLKRRRPGGMGVYLTRELTDGMFHRDTGEGNELTLIKVCIDTKGGP